MDKKYLDERSKRTTDRIYKLFIQMTIITLGICSVECVLLMRLFQYIVISRFDMIAFTIVIGGFFGGIYWMILKEAKKMLVKEMRLYKFCIDCCIEHEKISYYKKEANDVYFKSEQKHNSKHNSI